jgi:hypothetical protein
MVGSEEAATCPFFSAEAPGLVISIGYGRVRPAKNQGGPASPLHCSRSSLKAISFIGATVDPLED